MNSISRWPKIVYSIKLSHTADVRIVSTSVGKKISFTLLEIAISILPTPLSKKQLIKMQLQILNLDLD